MIHSCEECGRDFPRRWSLTRHLKLLHGIPNYATTVQKLSARPAPYMIDHRERTERGDTRDQFPAYEEDSKSDSQETMEGSENEQRGGGSTGVLSEDSASGGEDSDAESTDFLGRIDKENENMDLTSEDEVPHSDEEYDDDDNTEDVDMTDENQRETFIRWPISKSHRITLPWTYWGSEPKIKKCRGWIRRIYEKENSTVIYNVKRALNVEIATLCEIVYNCLHYQIPIGKHNFYDLRRHKKALRLLADSSVSMEEKRECILLRGAEFVNTILDCIHPLMMDDRLSAIKVPEANNAEEPEDDYEEN